MAEWGEGEEEVKIPLLGYKKDLSLLGCKKDLVVRCVREEPLYSAKVLKPESHAPTLSH